MTSMILIIIAGTVFLGGILVLLISSFTGKRRDDFSDGNARRRIAVDKGVDIKKLTYGQEKGAIFEAGQELYGTVLQRGGIRHTWNAQFEIIGSGRIEKISFRDRMAIGRKEPSSRQFPFLEIPDDRMISSVHCFLTGTQGILVIQDAGSLNHTYLNNAPVKGQMQVPSGSLIGLGRTQIRITYVYR